MHAIDMITMAVSPITIPQYPHDINHPLARDDAATTYASLVNQFPVVRFDEVRGARMELRAMGISVPSPDPRAAPQN